MPTKGPLAPGWFGDPSRRNRFRYWAGEHRTARVADGEEPRIESSWGLPVGTRSTGTQPASPLLWGIMVGGLLGAVAVVSALAFPHSLALPGGRIGSSEQLGGIWYLIGAAVVVGILASGIVIVRNPPSVVAAASNTPQADDRTCGRALVLSCAPSLAIGLVAAGPTWIQGWPAIFACAVLATLVCSVVTATSQVLRLSYLERLNGPLRTQGWLSAIRGNFLTGSEQSKP